MVARLGQQGEDAAAKYLLENGYKVIERNWRYRHYEIDIIAMKGNEIHFVEVKTRNHDYLLDPASAVDMPKIKRIVKAADVYLKKHICDFNREPHFDIICLVANRTVFQLMFYENAFVPPIQCI